MAEPRRKSFIDIITEGQGDIAGSCSRRPGPMGMTPENAKEYAGYDPDVQKNRAEAQQLMQRFGYGPGNRLRSRLRCATCRTCAIRRCC